MSAGTSDSLKKQFQQLQEQQQKKLMRRKKLKEEREKDNRQPPTDTDGKVSAFGIEDDLDLKLADPPAKGTIISEDLVDHLNEQIRELKDETGRLYKLLSERDLEVRQLRKKQQDHASLGSVGAVTNDTAATKIVELSKKVREITAELESEKTKSKQLTKKCYNLENELQNTINAGENTKGKSTTGNSKILLEDHNERQAIEAELKSSQEKLKQTELKMTEFRNQCQSLRQELKAANKVIGQEVGEGATIQSLLNNTSNWRGRAQQIITLQKKVNELRSQLDLSPSRGGGGSELSLEEEMLGSAVSRTSRGADERQREQIRKMERERKEAHEKLSKEMKALEEDHENLKHKMDASKARNKVLSSELKSCKQQIQTLLGKGKHDDELIEALLKQQSRLKTALEQNTKTQESAAQEQISTKKQLAMKTQQENNLIEQLRIIVSEKEAKVKVLEDEIHQMRRQRIQLNGAPNHRYIDQSQSESPPPQNPAIQHSDQSSRPPTGGSIRTGSFMYDVADSDCGTLTPQSSSRAVDTRVLSRLSGHEASDLTDRPSSRKSSARPGSANRADRQLLEDLQRQCQENKSLCQAASVERDRLSGLVNMLNKRIEELTQQATDAQTELVGQRRRNAQLEKQLGKVKVEQAGNSAKKPKSKSQGSSSISLRESVALDDDIKMTTQSLDELQITLDIQRDENAALKTALQSTLRSKEEDLRLYGEMIEETKKVFLQGLRQYRAQQGQS